MEEFKLDPLSVRTLTGEKCLDKTLNSAVEEASKSTSKVFLVREVLDFAQQQRLSENFPEFRLSFLGNVKHSHPYPSASRKLENASLLKRLSIDSIESLPGFDDVVCDVGGEFSNHLLSGAAVHSCCPMLDMRDQQRRVARFERLRRFLGGLTPMDYVNRASAIHRVRRFVEGEEETCSKFVCYNRAQECERTACYGIALHSSYDISLEDFSDIMIRKNMNELYGTFIYSDRVLVEKSGFIEGVECFFNIFEDKGVIEFSFDNDLSMVYRHTLKNYFGLLSVNCFSDKLKRFSFFVELLENRAGIQFFKITKLPFVPKCKTLLTRYMWLPTFRGKMKVNFFDLDYNALATGNFPAALKKISFFVESSLVNKVMSHAFASTETKFRPVEIFNFLLAYNGRIFFGSDVCVRNKQMPAYEAMLLANAIYLEVFIKKYDIGKIVQLLMAAVKHDRELAEASLMDKLFKSKFSPPKVFGSGHHNVLKVFRSCLAPLHAVLWWAKVSPFAAFQFVQENVKFIRCDTALNDSFFSVFNSKDEVVSNYTVSMPSILNEEASFDLKRVLRGIVADYFPSDSKVVALKDLVPEKFVPGNRKVDSSVSVVFHRCLAEVFPILPVNRFLDVFTSGSLSDAKNGVCQEGSLEGGSALLLGVDLDLIRSLVAKGFSSVFCIGTTLDVLSLLEEKVFSCVKILEPGEDDLPLYVVNAVYALSVSAVFINSSSGGMTKVINAVCNENFRRIKVFLKFSVATEPYAFMFHVSCVKSVKYDKDFFSTYFRVTKTSGSIGALKTFLEQFDKGTPRVVRSEPEVTVPEDVQSIASSTSFVTVDEVLEELSSETVEDNPLAVVLYDPSVVQRPVFCPSCEEPEEKLLGMRDDEFFRRKVLADVTKKCLAVFGMVCRSGCKLVELLEHSGVSSGRALDLCAAPGGFTQVLMWAGFKVTSLVKPGTVLCVVPENTVHEDIGDFITEEKFDLVCADGAVDVADSLGEKCEEQLEIFRNEIRVGLQAADVMILKLAMIPGIESLLQLIPRLKFFRPRATMGISLEFYVIVSRNYPLADLQLGYSSLVRERNLAIGVFLGGVFEDSDYYSSFEKRMFNILKIGGNKNLDFFRVFDRLKFAAQNFVGDLCFSSSTRRPGALGERREWLYAPVDYVYGGNRTVPISNDLPLWCTDFPFLSRFNALLVVYYSKSTQGLRFHKDDEEVMASEEVLTLSVGAPCKLKIKSSKGVQDFTITSDMFYVLKDQSDVLHAVETCGERWALTFRHFRKENKKVVPGEVVMNNPGMGDCLFFSLMGCNDAKKAQQLREFIFKNRPSEFPHPAYSAEEVDEECRALHTFAGTATIAAFCVLFHSNVVVRDTHSGQVLLDLNFSSTPYFSLVLNFSDCHYVRVASMCCSSPQVAFNFQCEPISLDYVVEILRKICWGDSSGVFNSLLSFFSRDGKILVFDGSSFSENMLLNVDRFFCFSEKCECLDGLCSNIPLCREKKVQNLFLLLSFNFRFFERLRVYLEEQRICWKIFVLPGLVKRGKFLLLLSFGEETILGVSLESAVEFVENHSQSCLGCASSVVSASPHYNYVFRTYYFCSSSEGQFVQFVSSLEYASKVFSLVPYSSENSGNIYEADNLVIVPIRLKSVGVLSDNRSNLNSLRRVFDKYFSDHGSVSCVGLKNCGLVDLNFFVEIFRKYSSKLLVLNEKMITPNNGVEFAPNYVPATGDESTIVNAMCEAREYYKASVQSIINNIKPLHDQYLRICSDRDGREKPGETSNNRPDYGLINMSKATFVIQPKEFVGPYSCAFNGKKLVDISSAFKSEIKYRDNLKIKNISEWLRPGCFHGLFSVCKDTKLVNSNFIYNKLCEYDLDKFTFRSKIQLVEGVPGCGKTHYIIENHKFSLKDTEHVVLTSSREAANDLRRRVAKKYRVPPSHKLLRLKYRTVDSFLMHFSKSDYNVKTLWLDEGLMKHFGDILWCAFLSQCEEVVIIGDRAQIPFLNRVANISLPFSKISLSPATLTRKFLNVTHRCPVDIAVLLNRFQVYESKVLSSSAVRRSVRSFLVSNLGNVLGGMYRDYQILTFTQDEKMSIGKSTGSEVFTINEFQGNQAPNILLVRTNIKNIPIFSSVPHILVGLSRHTTAFVYVTVVEDDCFKICSGPVYENEIEECRADLRGGGLVLGRTSGKQYPLFKTVPRASTMIDYLKQQVVVRNFVQDNLGSGVVPLRVELQPVDCPLPEVPLGKPYYVSDPITTMQYYYDEIFPGHSTVNPSYDSEIFSQDELYFSTKEMLRFTEFETHRRLYFDTLSPSLRTSCPTPVGSDIKQVLKAYYDRNGNVPILQGLVDEPGTVDAMFEVFRNVVVGDRELFDTFEDNPVTINVDSIEDWLATQPGKVAEEAFDQQFANIFQRELNSYTMILKKLPKPKLDLTAIGKYPSPQTIAHLTKDVNAFFCPVFREIKRRLISVLRGNIIFFSDMSIEDFEEILTNRLPAEKLEGLLHLLEADIAKYDKSQGRLAFLLEMRLLIALGFPPEWVSTWLYMHVYTRIMDKINKVVARVFFQRKSGDPWTFGGNTLFLLVSLIFLLCLRVVGFREKLIAGDIVALFSGDDSLIFSSFPISLEEITDDLARSFNLESKLLKFSTPYFCSKFLIMTPWGRWVIVPDVVKLLIKLGRHDLVNEQHVEEYRISCVDVAKHLGNSVLYPLIDDCIRDRYGMMSYSFGSLYSAMHHCFADPDTFSRLYYRADFATISDRVFRQIHDF